MGVYRWSTSEKEPGDGRLTFARRWFVHWGPDDHREDAHLDVYISRKPGHGWGFSVRFDGPHAETPIDVGLFLGRWLFVFAGTSKGRRLNRWLGVTGECEANRWQGGSRELSIRVTAGDILGGKWAENLLVEWSLWADREHQVFGKWNRREMLERRSRAYVAVYEHLRRGYHHPARAALNLLLGKTVHTLVESDPVHAVVCMPEGEYPVTVTLEQRTWKRPRSLRPWARHTAAEVEVVPTAEGGPGYCPTGKVKYGHDDGTVSTTGGRQLTAREAADPAQWVPIGVAAFTESVLKERARHRHLGWVPDHPTDREITV